MNATKEIKLDLCSNHRDMQLNEYYPGYVFQEYIFFPERPCGMPECEEDAFHTMVGIQIPDTVGEIKRENNEKLCRGIYEIYAEARLLLKGDSALDRLTYYLRTRIVPSGDREFMAAKLIRHYARLILKRLKINPDTFLSDKDKHRILLELGLYPEDADK